MTNEELIEELKNFPLTARIYITAYEQDLEICNINYESGEIKILIVMPEDADGTPTIT